MNPRPWAIDVVVGPASALHAASAGLVSTGPVAGSPGRTIRILEADEPAVVLGSAEPDDHVDRAARRGPGMAVVRRRSGGSAVLVGPGQVLWVDVIVPVGDPLWQIDVGRAGWWLGGCWAAALADVGIGGAQVWRGAMIRSRWSPRVCFAGLGPGEVTVEGAKVVGMSQRRTRVGALFQCAVPLLGLGGGPLGPWDPGDLLDVPRPHHAGAGAGAPRPGGGGAGGRREQGVERGAHRPLPEGRERRPGAMIGVGPGRHRGWGSERGMGQLDGRVAIITGAGRGLGREHALLFASEGASVVVNDVGSGPDGRGRDEGAAQAVVDEITAAGGQAVANTDDVADWHGGSTPGADRGRNLR